MHHSRGSWRWLAPLLCAICLPAWADGGRITQAEGGRLLRAGAEPKALERGMVVQPGDTLETSRAAGAQVWMEDDSIYALAADSSLRIDEFVTPRPQGNSAGKAVMTLLKGAFRSVSGLIGKGGRGTSQVHTDVATMGIRGTTWSAARCQGQCRGKRGQRLPDGLYVSVQQGLVVITNQGGSLDVPAGRIGYAANSRTRAEIVVDGPSLFVDLDNQVEFEFEVEPDLDRIEPPVSPS